VPDTLTLTIPVEGGKLRPSFQQDLALSGFLAKRDGKAVVVQLSKPVTRRATSQNSLYWGVHVKTLAEHTGYAPEELHEILKGMFLPRHFKTVGKIEVEVQKSTRELTAEEFSKYLEQIEAWAADELGVSIQAPART